MRRFARFRCTRSTTATFTPPLPGQWTVSWGAVYYKGFEGIDGDSVPIVLVDFSNGDLPAKRSPFSGSETLVAVSSLVGVRVGGREFSVDENGTYASEGNGKHLRRT